MRGLPAEPAELYGEVRVETWSPSHSFCFGGQAAFSELDRSSAG